MPRYHSDVYKGHVVFLKCRGGEIVAIYQKPGSPPTPRVIQLDLEDSDIPPLSAQLLEQIKRDQGVDFSRGLAMARLMPSAPRPIRVVPIRVFVDGVDRETGLKCHIEERILWVDVPVKR